MLYFSIIYTFWHIFLFCRTAHINKIVKKKPFFNFKYQLLFFTRCPVEEKYCSKPLYVSMLFKCTRGVIEVGLTEDVCSYEAKSAPHCLSCYTPTFTSLALKRGATGPLDLLIGRDFLPSAVSAMGIG